MTDYAKEFLEMLDTYHREKEIYDDKLDADLMRQELFIKENPKIKFPPRGTVYFSPSSVTSCQRELYMKLTGARKDIEPNQPHRRRWTKMGTLFGDMLQKELMYIEKHYEKLTLEEPPFVMERTEEGFPFYEDFVKTCAPVQYKGKSFHLFGKPDGVMIHNKTGNRVGLEIKSKQTTYAKTSYNSMKEPSIDHILQCVCYSLMYPNPDGTPLRDYLIVYGNLSKKNWFLSEEEYEKYPDIRVFHIHITDELIQQTLDPLVEVLEAVETRTPPKMDIERFTFNNFKEATAKSLTEEEFEEVKNYAKKVIKSNIPQYAKDNLFENYQLLKRLREK
jgi:hypothetical protein